MFSGCREAKRRKKNLNFILFPKSSSLVTVVMGEGGRFHKHTTEIAGRANYFQHSYFVSKYKGMLMA